MIIAAGTPSQDIAGELSRITGSPLLNFEIIRFPDQECYIRALDDVKGEKVVIVNTAWPDNNIIETLLLQDSIRNEAEEVATVIPYMGYSRQDKKFKPGEALSARTIIEALSRSTDHFGVINLHKESVIEYSHSSGSNIPTYKVIARYLSSLPEPPDMIMGPDKGARHIAASVAELMDAEWDHLDKIRIDGEHVEMEPVNSSVKGKRVAIVDDIISTGGTIARATERLKEKGATRVYAICTHGLFTGKAREKLEVCDIVSSSDTIETDFSQFSAAPAIQDYLLDIGFL